MPASKSRFANSSKSFDMKGRRTSPSTSTAPRTVPGKLPVQSPSSVSKFILVLLMHICRKILIVNTLYKLGIYLIGVMVGSMITDFFPFPPSYFSNKKNFLNVYFVKMGWGWTLALLLPFVILTNLVTSCGNLKEIIQKHVSRLGIATIYWYVCVNVFQYIEEVTGVCSSGLEEKHTSKARCAADGFDWIAIDISGHCFLLVHCLLTIAEEVKSFEEWDKIADYVNKEERYKISKLSANNLNTIKENHVKYTPGIRALIVALTILQCTWEIMLIGTTMYFHNMPQKVMGVLFASLGWFICYNIWYKSNGFPDLPTSSSLNFRHTKH